MFYQSIVGKGVLLNVVFVNLHGLQKKFLIGTSNTASKASSEWATNETSDRGVYCARSEWGAY